MTTSTAPQARGTSSSLAALGLVTTAVAVEPDYTSDWPHPRGVLVRDMVIFTKEEREVMQKWSEETFGCGLRGSRR